MASLVESEASLRDQAQIWKYLFGFADSMALKCAVELRIPDILHSHPEPITLAQIAAAIPDAPSPDLSYLFRIMRLLVRRKIFTFQQAPDGSEEGCLYGPTSLSRWLLREPPTPPSDPRRGHHLTLAPMVLQENHPWFLDSWHLLSRTVREGGDCPFEKAYGEMFAFAGKNPEFNRLLNEGMACTARITITTILSHYGDGLFRGGDDDGSLVRSIVDVGGGTGSVVSEIVKAYPHIRGINFDRPHVVKTAPEYPGVTHVGGDMFQEVPPADAVFTKASTLPA
ncbi:O-methyltransferase COMT-type [Trema orientale]|uniref:O-methyltransferase COMT-type n=1 Tax=Trema orientale TaxID=63057 RepID=A0A2P5EZI0_TREOI|nr:O-methyltransferase COMT-type [Trema orientale]